MLTVAEAQERILAACQPLAPERVPLDRALGLHVTKPVVAPRSLPPFANSAMDGFALMAADTQVDSERVALHVAGHVPAGAVYDAVVQAGQAVRIMTGAPLPPGADTVVPFEDTLSEGDRVSVPASIPLGACVRPAGMDIRAGQEVLAAGTRIGARQVALCAALGLDALSVHRRPSVAVLATGDELVEPGGELRPGQIYNSNGHALAAAVRELGAEVRVLGVARDDPTDLRAKLLAAEGCDLLLSSGGVSVGDFDHVKDVLGATGALDFWRVRIRPGKPLAFGTLAVGDGVLLLGLPGNPTSTMVTFYVFARPALLKMMGARQPTPEPVHAILDDPLDNGGGRETYFRVHAYWCDGALRACLAGGQDSSMVLSLARANALARVFADVQRLDAGESVDLYLLDGGSAGGS